MKGLSQTQFETLDKSEKKRYVKEWVCVCNSCGEKWHYLDGVEKKMNEQVGLNACLQVSSCCNPCVGAATSNANTQLTKQISELKQCPKCKSANVKRTAQYFSK